MEVIEYITDPGGGKKRLFAFVARLPVIPKCRPVNGHGGKWGKVSSIPRWLADDSSSVEFLETLVPIEKF